MGAGEIGRGREPAVVVSGIGKSYMRGGRTLEVLRDLSLTVEEGEFVCLVGPSGCGKTTVLRGVAGLLPMTHGTIRVRGVEVRRPYPRVGMVFQSPVLMPWRTAIENVMLPTDLLRQSRASVRERASELLQLVGLEDWSAHYPDELSGGMQQRVAIARALMHDPWLLLLDEPFGALDQLTREAMNVEMTRIWRATRKTTMMTTHGIEEAVFLSDRVVVLAARPATVAGIVRVDLARPRDPAVRLSQPFNRLKGEVESLLRTSGGWQV